MNSSILVCSLFLMVAASADGQGTFLFRNTGAPTHLGSIDGPLADSTIWAQMLVGMESNSLSPVYIPLQHFNGRVPGPTVTVPGIPGDTLAYFQMVAWNGDLWGSSLASVPVDQVGRTDIIPLVLTFFWQPASTPFFSQPAIVPTPVPEPSAWALGVFGALVFLLRRRRL